MRKVIFALIMFAFVACHKEPQYPCENNVYKEIYKWDVKTESYLYIGKTLTPECACQAQADMNPWYATRPVELRYQYKCVQ